MLDEVRRALYTLYQGGDPASQTAANAWLLSFQASSDGTFVLFPTAHLFYYSRAHCILTRSRLTVRCSC
jgi:hypothetical protein